jgi:hypothetical protein
MQRVKGAVFFQLASSAAASVRQLKFQDCIPASLSLSLSLCRLCRRPVCVCMLTCQISGAALHGLLHRGAGEAFGITPCSVCARDICTGCELYALPAAAIRRRNLLLSVLRQPRCKALAACPRFPALFRFFPDELARQLWDLPQLDCYRECSAHLRYWALEAGIAVASFALPKRISSIAWG